MNEPTKSSTLFQDLIALEKDYTYNMTQLKIKEDEIIRFQVTNKTQEETMKTHLNEIKELKYKLRDLEEALTMTKQSHEQEKLFCADIIKRLSVKINELKHSHEEEIEEQRNLTSRRCDEVNMQHVKKLEEINDIHRSSVEETENRYKKEKSKVCDLKNQTTNLMEENMTLRNKIREIETHLIPELTIFKTELKTCKYENKNLTSQLATIREEHENEHNKLTQTISEVQLKDNQIQALDKEKNALVAANKKLSLQLQDCFKSNKELLVRAAGYEDERQQLCAEIGQLAVIAGSRIQCNVPQHEKCNDIFKQNVILQQTVKAMRQEMEGLAERRLVENEGAEERLDNLERLVVKLKETLKYKYSMDMK